jgi:transposase InsO family protein
MNINSEFNINFEFTAPGTPQQNGIVERAFATLFGKTRSMLNAARITIPLRKKL